jgi:tRNA U34 5-methylaminomethyl-2-thiouridine-forming methyltransferase MnmC
LGHEEDYAAIHRSPWGQDVALTPWFTLHKIAGDFTQYKFEKGYDIVYFDAFAPEKQPEMWDQKLFDSLYECLNNGGILTTYCAKGVVRRMLQSSGFVVERLAGPPGGKREILRATKQ